MGHPITAKYSECCSLTGFHSTLHTLHGLLELNSRHWCLPLLLWKARSCSKSRTPRPLDHTLTVSVAPSPFNKILTDCCPGSLTHGTNSPLTSNQQKLCTSLVESWTTYLSIWKKHNIHLFFSLYPNGWTHFIYLSCFEEKHLLNKSNVLWLQFAICSHF